MDRDSCANLGVLAMFDTIFRPGATMGGRQNPPGYEDPEDEVDEEAEEAEQAERDNYRETYAEDSDPGICGRLFDGN